MYYNIKRNIFVQFLREKEQKIVQKQNYPACRNHVTHSFQIGVSRTARLSWSYEVYYFKICP